MLDIFRNIMAPVCGDGLLLIATAEDDLEDMISTQYNTWMEYDRPAYIRKPIFSAAKHKAGEVVFGRN